MSVELRHLNRHDLSAVRDLLGDRCEALDAAEVAEEKLFGAAPNVLRTEAFGAFSGGSLIGVAVASGTWLRLLAVAPTSRALGVGSSLLAMTEAAVAETGSPVVRTMDQPGNYLSPGIDEHDEVTLRWLSRRGYHQVARNSNLLIALRDNPRVTGDHLEELRARAAEQGYELARAGRHQAPAIADAVGAGFSAAWAFEVERALMAEPTGVHVALHRGTGALAAFAVHDGNNRGLGWFGPAGTFEAHRKRGLGEALLVACLLDVAETRSEGVIAWVGPRQFYERAVGVSGERNYLVLEKRFSEDSTDAVMPDELERQRETEMPVRRRRNSTGGYGPRGDGTP